MKKTLVEKYVENPEQMRLFQQERAIVEVTDMLESAIEELGISRSRFAKLLGKSKGWVTQLLDGEANKSIRTVADAFAVLGQEYRSFYQPIRISNKSSRSASKTLPTMPLARRGLADHRNSVQTISAQELIQESA